MVRYFALLGFTIGIWGLSFLMYKLPFQIMEEEFGVVFYSIYLAPSDSNITFILVISWFLVGSWRTTLIMVYDKKESYFTSLNYRLKALVFVPLSMFIRFEVSWYKLPSVEYMNNK
jgi:hypothetical protein